MPQPWVDLRIHATLTRIICPGIIALAMAQGAAQAACVVPVTSDYADAFVSDPRMALQNNPRGGETFAWQIRSMATASMATLRAVGTIIPQANPMQKEAIGMALARANAACSSRSGEMARRIVDLVRRTGDRDVTRTFSKYFTANNDPPAPLSFSTGTKDSTPETGRRVLNFDRNVGSQPLPMGNPFRRP